MSFQLTGNVTFAYRKNAVILRDLNFNLDKGQTIAVMGRSGLGKTTLLNLLGLLWDRPQQEGLIVYTSPRTGLRSDYRRISAGEKARLRREEFGLVPQNTHFLSGFTCRQNLRIPRYLHGENRRAADSRINQVLHEVRRLQDCDSEDDLSRILDHFPQHTSTGQRQRLSVIRAILHDPIVLFADEPVSNLDDRNKHLMLDLLKDWRAGNLAHSNRGEEENRSLILVCHEIETAWEIADRFLFLHPPTRKNELGACAELLTRAEFCDIYGVSSEPRQNNVESCNAIRTHLNRGPDSGEDQ